MRGVNMTEFNWDSFIKELEKFQKGIESIGGYCRETIIEAPAKEEEILEVEKKLGYTLPKDFRDILLNYSSHFEYFWSTYKDPEEEQIEFPENIEGDIIINTTPVGMYPNIEDNIVDEQILKKFKIAIDLIYNPLETKFLKIARENGLKIINGMEMLIEQALKTDEILYDIVLSNQLREKIIKKIVKRVKEFYENNGN